MENFYESAAGQEADFHDHWLQGLREDGCLFTISWDLVSSLDGVLLEARWEQTMSCLQGNLRRISHFGEEAFPPNLTESQRRDFERCCRTVQELEIRPPTVQAMLDGCQLWRMCSNATDVEIRLQSLARARAFSRFLESGAAHATALKSLTFSVAFGNNATDTCELCLQPILDAANDLDSLSLTGPFLALIGRMRLPEGLSELKLSHVHLSDTSCEDLVETVSLSSLVVRNVSPVRAEARLLQTALGTTRKVDYEAKLFKDERFGVFNALVAGGCIIRSLTIWGMKSHHAIPFWRAMRQNATTIELSMMKCDMNSSVFSVIEEALTENTTLKRLKIDGSSQGQALDTGDFGRFLATNHTLEQFELHDYRIKSGIVRRILSCNTGLTRLDVVPLLSDSDDGGHEMFKEELASNSSLVEAAFWCEDRRSGRNESPFGGSFVDFLQSNTTLRDLDLAWTTFDDNGEEIDMWEMSSEQRRRMEYFLKLNARVDRKGVYLRRREDWITALVAVTDDLDCIFSLVTRNPSICEL